MYHIIPLSLCGLSLDVLVVVVTGMTVAVVTLPVAVVVGIISLVITLAVVSEAILTAADVTLDCSSVTGGLVTTVGGGGGGGNIMGGGGCWTGGWSCRDGWLSSGGGIGLNELGAGMLPIGMEAFTVSTSGPDCYKGNTYIINIVSMVLCNDPHMYTECVCVCVFVCLFVYVACMYIRLRNHK